VFIFIVLVLVKYNNPNHQNNLTNFIFYVTQDSTANFTAN